MLNRSIVALLVAGALSLGWLSLGVDAQPMDLKTTPPARERVAPSVPDRDLHPQRPALPDRPNFIAPLSKNTKSGRAGVAGWSAPNPPVGSRVGGDHDNPGWPGVGFAIEWGRPERAD
ncbi:MAG TPA: hypothetical protein VIE41_17980 [Methylomirabilota bacterium]|jgi:hypothetical protein